MILSDLLNIVNAHPDVMPAQFTAAARVVSSYLSCGNCRNLAQLRPNKIDAAGSVGDE